MIALSIPNRVALLSAVAMTLALAGCDEPAEPQAEPARPVRVVVAESRPSAEIASLTGTVEAAETVALAFRTGGRVIERLAGVGDRVEAGELIGRLDAETQRNALQAARAELVAALGERDRADAEYERQAQLLERGFTTRQRYDIALQARRAARSAADAAEARVATAEEQLAFTELYADAPGVVTAIGAEPGEVVAPGAMVLTVAREGGRDAVFDVPERLLRQAPPDPAVTVKLTSDPAVQAEGRVREVTPQADPVTRTFRVRVGLIDPPADLRLGSTVTGEVLLGRDAGIELPASALVEREGGPAVFIFDAAEGVVRLRPVTVGSFNLSSVLIEDGITEGETVVTAGVQALRPGQAVRVAGAPR
jgi:RND family efflux transporter MFP subunit